MQPGIVGLRRAITESWENDLRAVRQDRYDVDKGKEAWSFIQRFYTMVSDLRSPIQRAWGPGGMVHVADSTAIGGSRPPHPRRRRETRHHRERRLLAAA